MLNLSENAVPLPPRIIPPEGKGKARTVQQWGIVQESAVQVAGKRLVLCVDENGVALPIAPNPRFMPVELLATESKNEY